MSLLEFCLATIFHELRVRTGENHEAVAPTRVAKTTASEQHFVVVDRTRLTIEPAQGAFEFIEKLIGRLAFNRKGELRHFAIDNARICARQNRFELLG